MVVRAAIPESGNGVFVPPPFGTERKSFQSFA
jgi:hypothetical protein